MPRCKECKEKFNPKWFNQKFCMDKDECIKAHVEMAKLNKAKQDMKEWNTKKKELSITAHAKKHKNELQRSINMLARMIDNKFNLPCIDCGRPYGKQQDGGHFKSVGSNYTLRFNLHNIHSQRSECNQNGIGGGRERQYYNGLIERYGEDYAIMVDTGLQQQYKLLKLTEHEVYEKLTLVRSIIRSFDTYQFNSPIEAREQLNRLIGIYKHS